MPGKHRRQGGQLRTRKVQLPHADADLEHPGVVHDAAGDIEVSGLTTDLSGKWTSKFNDNKTEVEAVVGWHRDAVKIQAVDPRFPQGHRAPEGRVHERIIAQDCMQLHGQVGHGIARA